MAHTPVWGRGMKDPVVYRVIIAIHIILLIAYVSNITYLVYAQIS